MDSLRSWSCIELQIRVIDIHYIFFAFPKITLKYQPYTFFLNIYISMFSRMIKSESSYMPVLIPTSKSTPRTSEIPDVFPYLFNGLLCTFDLISNWVSVIGTSCIKAGLRLSLKVLLKFTNPNIGTVTNSRFTIYLFFFKSH